MNLERLKPWNWFKHEEKAQAGRDHVPVTIENRYGTDSGMSDPLMQLHADVNRLFDNVFHAFNAPLASYSQPQASPGYLSRPQLDITGDNNQYEVTLNVPGLRCEDVSIEVRGDQLTIHGQREQKRETKDKHYYRIERSVGAFHRTLSLPDDVNADEIQAKLTDGVLHLSIPRRQIPDKDVKRIEISS